MPVVFDTRKKLTLSFLSEHLFTSRFQDFGRRESVGLTVDLDQKSIPGSKNKEGSDLEKGSRARSVSNELGTCWIGGGSWPRSHGAPPRTPCPARSTCPPVKGADQEELR